MATDRKQTLIRPPTWLREQWDEDKDESDHSTLSSYLIDMIEAGRKKFDRSDPEPNETAVELREQRNTLRDDLDRKDRRIRELENRLDHGEHAQIRRYVTENPGVDYDHIVSYTKNHAPERVNRHLDELDGDELREDDEGRWYPADATGEVGGQ